MPTNATASARILLVDDEEMILQMYKSILAPPHEESGPTEALTELASELFGDETEAAPMPCYDVSLCRQGADAVDAVAAARAEGRPFAIVVMDVLMPPGMNGVTAAEKIRAIDPDLNIVFVTGYARVDPDEIAARVPPEDKFFYMVKPLQSVELERLVASLADSWHSAKTTAAA